MTPGPLPPHERAWRHPSELAAPAHEPTSRVSHVLIGSTAALSLLLVAWLAFTMTPKQSGDADPMRSASADSGAATSFGLAVGAPGSDLTPAENVVRAMSTFLAAQPRQNGNVSTSAAMASVDAAQPAGTPATVPEPTVPPTTPPAGSPDTTTEPSDPVSDPETSGATATADGDEIVEGELPESSDVPALSDTTDPADATTDPDAPADSTATSTSSSTSSTSSTSTTTSSTSTTTSTTTVAPAGSPKEFA